MDELKLFIPIQKIDEEKRLLIGRLTEEVADSSGEIFDFATSKPYFEDWVGYFQKATDGKSCGNLRAMHDSKKAVGFLPEVHLLDKEKAVEIVAKVVDDDEWNKCLEGVYTGFSQGGKYIKKWYDGKYHRYTAQPNEASLVDYPMAKTSTFSLVKANGIVENLPFKQPEEIPLFDILEKIDTLSDGQVTDLVFRHIPLKEIDARWSRDQATFELKKVAQRKDVNPEEGEKKYGDVKFADEKNKKYPIDTEEHIRAAWNYINKAKNAAKYGAEDVKTIKAKIVAAWKKKIDKDGPPSAKESEKVEKIESLEAAKGALKKYAGEEISDVSSATYALQSIAYLYVKEKEEGEDEQVANLRSCIDNLKAFIASEIMEADEDDVMTLSEKVGKLIKADMPEPEIEPLVKAFDAVGYELRKKGASISASNLTKLQAMHDHCVDMGAKCNKAAKSDSGADLVKVTAERDEALKKVSQISGEKKEGEIDLKKIIGERDESIKKVVELSSRLETLKDADGALKKVTVDLDEAKKKASELITQIDELKKADAAKAELERKAAQERAEAMAKENEVLKKGMQEKDETLKKVTALAVENEVLKGKEKEMKEALQKVETLTTEKDALAKELTEIKKQPEPAKGNLKAVPVTKQDDTAGPDAIKKDEAPKTPEEAMMKVHSEPIRGVPGERFRKVEVKTN